MSLFDNIENRMVTATCKNAAKAVSDIMKQDGLVNKLRDAVSESFQKVYSDFNLSMPGMEDLHDALSQSVDASYKELVGEEGLHQVMQSSNIADQLFQSAARPFDQVSQKAHLMENPIVRQKSEDFFKALKAEVLHHLNSSEWDVKLKDLLPGDMVEESKTFIHKGMEQLYETMGNMIGGKNGFSSLLKTSLGKRKGLSQMMGNIPLGGRQAVSALSRGMSLMDNAAKQTMGESYKHIAHNHFKMTEAHKALIKDMQKNDRKADSCLLKTV